MFEVIRVDAGVWVPKSSGPATWTYTMTQDTWRQQYRWVPVLYEKTELGSIRIIPNFPREISESQYNKGIKGLQKLLLDI